MNYLCLINNILYVDNKVIDKTFNKYIDELALPYFKTLSSIRLSTKKILNIKKNIPLYISNKILLIPIIIKNIKYYINYYSLFKTLYKNNELMMCFNDGETLSLNLSYSKYKTYVENSEKIVSYLGKYMYNNWITINLNV